MSGLKKNIVKEITLYLQCHLSSKAITPSNIERVQVVVGGDHRDVAFQFGMSLSVELIDRRIIDFEVSVCKVTCRKDTSKITQTYHSASQEGIVDLTKNYF